MPTYDSPYREVYEIPSAAFGATTASLKFQGPPGKVGLVRDITVEASADMVGTTTVPEVDVGSAASTAGGTLYTEYARFRLGSAVGTGYTAANSPFRARTLAQNAQGRTGSSPPALSDYAGHIALETARIPADTAFVISTVAGVGGVPAGTARVEVTVEWF